jgi:hypothetical protein
MGRQSVLISMQAGSTIQMSQQKSNNTFIFLIAFCADKQFNFLTSELEG